ncbi:hypothetical protein ACNVED_04390 [Legionella sp. D16C41]|uniref:hypothetical protein n=1 Tax=Legionella sp. D16C41 TaxID=3402688 RepID=UPI003AF75C4B
MELKVEKVTQYELPVPLLYSDPKKELHGEALKKYNYYLSILETKIPKSIEVNESQEGNKSTKAKTLAPWIVWEMGFNNFYKEMIYDAFKAYYGKIAPAGMEVYFSGSLAKSQATQYSDLDAFVILPSSGNKKQDLELLKKVKPVFEGINNLCQRIFYDKKQTFPDPLGINPARFIGTVENLFTALKSEVGEELEEGVPKVVDQNTMIIAILSSKAIWGSDENGKRLKDKIRKDPELSQYTTAKYFYGKAEEFKAPQKGAEEANIKAHVLRPLDFIIMGLRDEFELNDEKDLSTKHTLKLLKQHLPKYLITELRGVFREVMLKRFYNHQAEKREDDELKILQEGIYLLERIEKLRKLVNMRLSYLKSTDEKQSIKEKEIAFEQLTNEVFADEIEKEELRKEKRQEKIQVENSKEEENPREGKNQGGNPQKEEILQEEENPQEEIKVIQGMQEENRRREEKQQEEIQEEENRRREENPRRGENQEENLQEEIKVVQEIQEEENPRKEEIQEENQRKEKLKEEEKQITWRNILYQILAVLGTAGLGAAIGAIIGTFVFPIPGVGTALGAAIGAGIGAGAGGMLGFSGVGLYNVWKNSPVLGTSVTVLGNTAMGIGLGALIGTFIFPGVGTVIGIALGAGLGAGLGFITSGLGNLVTSKTKVGAAAATGLTLLGSAGLGATIGAIIGTFIFPGVGTLIGLGLGAGLGAGLGLAASGIINLVKSNTKLGAGASTGLTLAGSAGLGAAIGFIIGSVVFPGVGTVLGTALGAGVGLAVSSVASGIINRVKGYSVAGWALGTFGSMGLGAGIGALIGTIFFPGAGTLIGAGVGAAIGFVPTLVKLCVELCKLGYKKYTSNKIKEKGLVSEKNDSPEHDPGLDPHLPRKDATQPIIIPGTNQATEDNSFDKLEATPPSWHSSLDTSDFQRTPPELDINYLPRMPPTYQGVPSSTGIFSSSQKNGVNQENKTLKEDPRPQ